MARMLLVCTLLFILGGIGSAGRLDAGQSAPPAAAPTAARIDLNTATVADLETLPGIGPRTAALIIEYREQNGGFERIEELMNVRGVGEKSFLRLKDLISVSPVPQDESGSSPQP